ncbi:MAG: protein kinase [Acidobacteria bacterium]|nr:protein kinase [Acidobacteriota bacterium]MBI3428044.1 protein kinase [Acidobacteriota bacterium]
MNENVIGNYQIQMLIGEGGMGTVFKGLDLMLEREVAIKVLRPELARQPQLVERFRAEAIALARLNHPFVATLHTLLRHDEDFLMVMEYVRGETLEGILRRSGALTLSQGLRLFGQVLEGIAHAHQLGIVHRDLKPANLMLTEGGTIKVMDFGIARLLGSHRMTRTGRIVGTLEYMSPEQVRGLETDGRSDIYALGIVLYEMLTGRAPFRSDSEYEVMHAHLEMPPPPPRQFAQHLPPVIEQIILRALAKDPAERFQSALDFHAALIDATRTAGLTPATLPSDVTPVVITPQLTITPSRPSAPSQPGAGRGRQSTGSRITPPAGLAAQLIQATRVAQASGAPSSPALAAAIPLRQRFNWKQAAAVAAALIIGGGGIWLNGRRTSVTPSTPPVALQATPTPNAAPAEALVAPSFTTPPQPGGPIPSSPADALNLPTLAQPTPASAAANSVPVQRTAPKRRTPNPVAPAPVFVPANPPPAYVNRPPVITRSAPVNTAAVLEEERRQEKERLKREEKERQDERVLKNVGGILSGAKDIWGALKGGEKKKEKEKKRQ